MVLDASMSANPDLMREIADRVTEKLFRGNETASDVRMSLVNFGAHVNIGTEYADKLITPESRMLLNRARRSERTSPRRCMRRR